MKNVLYVDVLVLLNIYISYFLFLSTKKILNLSVSRFRMIIGCVVSGGFSLIILFDCAIFELLFIKLTMGTSLCFIVFFKGKLRIFLKTIMTFFVVNFLFGGLMLCIWYLFTPPAMQFKNGVVYFNISAVTLVICSIIAYCAIILLTSFFSKRNSSSEIYSVKLSYKGRETTVTAFLDTGNKLVDSFSGLPIMICELSALKNLFSNSLYNYFLGSNIAVDNIECFIENKLRMIPMKAISGEICLPAFKPDSIVLKQMLSKDEHNSNVLIAITKTHLSDGTFQALISTAM